MLANKSALFAIAAAFMLLATVEAAPTAEAAVQGAISTSVTAPKLADPETSHKGHTTSTPSKGFGAITSVVD
ncbi:hypothetical protein CPB97_000889 [Podila verticillata]|nr:hypothetical protein CPB97_000889 [Podila verticillata]